MVRLISSTDISSLLPTIPLAAILHSQALAFQSLSSGQCPPRLSLTTPNHTQLFMPARTTTTTSSSPSVVKIVSVPQPSVGGGIPGINLLFSDTTGKVSHIVNSTTLTALRTAAGSLLSSILALGQGGEVKEMVVYGDGAQGVFHVWLHLRYFSDLNRVNVVVGSNRELSEGELEEKERRFKGQLFSLMPQHTAEIRMVNGQDQSSVQAAVGSASIIATCTPSTSPLFPHSWLKGPINICAVGSYKPHMCELPPELVRHSFADGTLIVDSQSACSSEAGCLIQALPPAYLEQLVELGTVLPNAEEQEGDQEWLRKLEASAEKWKGRGGVSIFKSVGVGLQDVEVTKLVVKIAEREGLGTEVNF